MVVRVGVVGTGIMGADHVRTLSSAVAGARVSAVTDLDEERAQAAVAGIDDARVFHEPLALVKDPDVDAVIVASADPTHEELVLGCIDAGKPVLCEKPLTPTPDGCLRIVAAEVAVDRRLVDVGFMRRYDPGFAEMARVLANGELGKALMLHCVHRNVSSRPNHASSALITGSAVHEIDIARWLLHEEIVRTTVHRPRRSSMVVGETQDPLFLVLETESGVLVDVEVFVNAGYGYDVRCELVAETGSLQLDQAVHTVRRDARRAAVGVADDWRDRFAEAYRVELQDWVDSVVAGEQRGASAWDGYVSTAVARAAIESLEGGFPTEVTLTARPDLYS